MARSKSGLRANGLQAPALSMFCFPTFDRVKDT